MPTARASDFTATPRAVPRTPVIGQISAGAIMVLAAGNYAWHLSSTYFADEIVSIRVADGPLGDLMDRVVATELAPPLYYALLHAWMQVTGGLGEATLRAPSVVLGVAVVAIIGWLGLRVAGAHVALVAAGLAAISPLLLTYAQQVRAYSLMLVLATAAIAFAIEADRTRRRRWWVLSCAAIVAALWTHYLAALITVPLLVYVGRSGGLSLRQRLTFSAVAISSWLPTLLLAWKQAPSDKVSHPSARLDFENVLQVAGAPFDARASPMFVVALGGAILCLAAIVVAWSTRRDAETRLILACAALPIVVLLLGGFVGADVLWSRYAAVAAPFMIVALALFAGRPRGAVLVVAAGVLMSLHLGRAHSASGRYADTRAAVEYTSAHWQPRDALVLTLDPTTNVSLEFYAGQRLPPGALLTAPSPATLERLSGEGRRLWIVSAPVSRAALDRALSPYARLRSKATFRAGPTLQVSLSVPAD